MAVLRIGSRGSQLALWQANHVAGLLRAQGHNVEIEVIKTSGDKLAEVSLTAAGAKGLFTKEIEMALGERRVDLAVHSLKDLPTELEDQFELPAILRREDPRDAFVSVLHRNIEMLPEAARVGTSSLRRQALVKSLRSDLIVEPLRGNVDTRLRKLEAGEFDAVILAHAGLIRLERTANVRDVLDPTTMCPAPGQGALALEIRRNDKRTREHVAFLDDARTRAAVLCERALLRALGGGCQVPIGAFASMLGDRLEVFAVVAQPDGSEVIRSHGKDKLENAEKLGSRVAEELLKMGANEILEELAGKPIAAPEAP
jgi:hydroxymethylbilane synthase